MSKYRLTEKEIVTKAKEAGFLINEANVWGYMQAQDNLCPLLEEKDHLISEQDLEITIKNNLLRECREFLVSMVGVGWSDEKHTELLTKLKDI